MSDKPHISRFTIDWDKGKLSHLSSSKSKQVQTDAISVVFFGDYAPSGQMAEAICSKSESILADFMADAGAWDFSVINVEAPLTSKGQPIIKDGPVLEIGPNVLSALASLKCKVACLANNHIKDFGLDGLEATVDFLSAMGIHPLGVGANIESAFTPFLYEKENIKLAIINVAEGEEAKATSSVAGVAPLELNTICKISSDLKNCGFVVCVVVHAGREMLPVPAPYIQDIYRTIANAGVHIIIGHHPHIPQGIEIWNETVIVYSLGNFLFPVIESPKSLSNIGYCIKVEITPYGINEVLLIPYKIEETTIDLLSRNTRVQFLRDLQELSDLLQPSTLAAIWKAYAQVWLKSQLSEDINHFLTLISLRKLLLLCAYRLRLGLSDERQSRRILTRFVASVFSRIAILYRDISPINNKQAKAVLRNRFDTLAHRELYLTALSPEQESIDMQTREKLNRFFTKYDIR